MGIIKTSGIFFINNRNELLVAHPTNHPEDFWSIPKGKKDDGEDSLSCAIRETWEEVNVDFRDIEFNYYRLETRVFKNKRKKLKPFVVFECENNIDFSMFDLKCNSNVHPDRGGFPEMDSFKWITLDEAKMVLHHSQVECLDAINELIIKNEFREPLV